MKIQNPDNVLPGAEGFFLKGSDTGVMMIHGGGGGTTADMREFSQYIHEATGFSVFVPLLPGYGTVKEDLLNIQVEDWLSAVKNWFLEFKNEMKKTFVLGHSMGGVLALFLGSEFVKDISGIVSISAPVKFKGLLIKFVPVFKYLLKYIRQNDLEEWARVTDGVWTGYEYIPLSIVGKFKKLVKLNSAQLNKITAPILIIQGTRDDFITKQSPTQIFEKVRSTDKTLKWFDSDHAILFSSIKTDMFASVIEFLKRL